MAQKADYSLDYYSLNDVFYGRVSAHQPAKKAQAPAPKEKSHKSFGFLSSFSRSHRSTPSYTEGKSPSCSTSEHVASPRSSVSS